MAKLLGKYLHSNSHLHEHYHIHTYTCTDADIHKYTHTHTHTHIYIYIVSTINMYDFLLEVNTFAINRYQDFIISHGT